MPNHLIVEDWMGEQVETLEDLLRPEMRAVCVGINPSLVSVEAGHYYQGQLGQRFLSRLREVGLLPEHGDGFEDDAAFASGVGFTDIVKRPSARADAVRADEYAHGRELLFGKLDQYRPELVVFTYKKTAEKLFGKFARTGFIARPEVPHSELFVMPGPMEVEHRATKTLAELCAYLNA